MVDLYRWELRTPGILVPGACEGDGGRGDGEFVDPARRIRWEGGEGGESAKPGEGGSDTWKTSSTALGSAEAHSPSRCDSDARRSNHVRRNTRRYQAARQELEPPAAPLCFCSRFDRIGPPGQIWRQGGGSLGGKGTRRHGQMSDTEASPPSGRTSSGLLIPAPLSRTPRPPARPPGCIRGESLSSGGSLSLSAAVLASNEGAVRPSQGPFLDPTAITGAGLAMPVIDSTAWQE